MYNHSSNDAYKRQQNDEFIQTMWFLVKTPFLCIGIILKEIWREINYPKIPGAAYPLAFLIVFILHQLVWKYFGYTLNKEFFLNGLHSLYGFMLVAAFFGRRLIESTLVMFLAIGLYKKFRLRLLDEKIRHIGEAFLKDFKIVDKYQVDPYLNCYKVKTNTLSSYDLNKYKGRIETALNITIKEINQTHSRKYIEIIAGDYIRLRDFSYDVFYNEVKNQFPNYKDILGIGVASFGLITTTYKNLCHLLVAGETGGGKSSFLRQFITARLLNSENIKLYLIDLKGGIEFNLFENIPNVTVAKDHMAAILALEAVDETLTERMDIFQKAGIRSFEDFNKRRSEKLPRIFICIDESAEIFSTKNIPFDQKTNAEKARRLCTRIARLSRAFGIHLILATQRPDSFVLDSQTNVNMASRLCFRMNTTPASVSVLGDNSAMKLPHTPGRALWKNGLELYEVQVPYLSDVQCEMLIKPLKRVIEVNSKIINPPSEFDLEMKGESDDEEK